MENPWSLFGFDFQVIRVFASVCPTTGTRELVWTMMHIVLGANANRNWAISHHPYLLVQACGREGSRSSFGGSG
jgi:hypothetical protein